MSKIDIRKEVVKDVNIIVFADDCGYNATQIEMIRGEAMFATGEGDSASTIATKEDAQNAILALQEAIDRGWWD